MSWRFEFIIAVSSSLTTALILYLIRYVIKVSNVYRETVEQTHFLMHAMDLVLKHLKLSDDAERFRNPHRTR